jgi:CubicO group peptidase (beta-lactamase class C family)
VADSLGFSDDARTRVDQVVNAVVAQGQVARGDQLHVATAGLMAVGGASMRRDTLFRITSMTKPMTAVGCPDRGAAGERLAGLQLPR